MNELHHIRFEITEGFATITLHRPEVHNAIDPVMISEITWVLNKIANESSLRALIIKGEGKSFSSGADLNYMNTGAGFSEDENREDAGKLVSLFDSLYNFPAPVISQAHGNISGGAIGIIAVSDISFCEDSAQFIFSEVKLGLIPAIISPFIIQKIGPGRSAELMFTAKRFFGKEAEDYGLVNRSVPDGSLEETLNKVKNDLYQAGPDALRKTKFLIRSVTGKQINSELLQFTSRLISDVRISAEAREGILAFFEKRKPAWTSK
jgi:methylglutaconyl-CoA hydratase